MKETHIEKRNQWTREKILEFKDDENWRAEEDDGMAFGYLLVDYVRNNFLTPDEVYFLWPVMYPMRVGDGTEFTCSLSELTEVLGWKKDKIYSTIESLVKKRVMLLLDTNYFVELHCVLETESLEYIAICWATDKNDKADKAIDFFCGEKI